MRRFILSPRIPRGREESVIVVNIRVADVGVPLLKNLLLSDAARNCRLRIDIDADEGIRRGNLRLNVDEGRIVKRLFSSSASDGKRRIECRRRDVFKWTPTMSRRPLIRVIILAGVTAVLFLDFFGMEPANSKESLSFHAAPRCFFAFLFYQQSRTS